MIFVQLTPAEIISDLISTSGKTLAEIEKETGIGQSTLSDFKNGRRDIRTKTLTALCKYFEASPSYILGLTPIKSPSQSTVNIHRATGLSEKAIENLRSIKKSDTSLNFINTLCEDPAALYSLSSLFQELLEGANGNHKNDMCNYIEMVDTIRIFASKQPKQRGIKWHR